MQSQIRKLLQVGAITLALVSCAGALTDITTLHQSKSEEVSRFGNYLSGRVAQSRRDSAKAAAFFAKALEDDPDNEEIIERIFRLEAAAGNRPRATEFAQKLVKKDDSHRVARLYLGVASFKSGQYEDALDHFGKVGRGPIAELTTVLSESWALQAQGKTALALARLTKVSSDDWARYYKNLHIGLIASVAKRNKQAGAAFAGAFRQESRSLRLALAYSRFAATVGNHKLARRVLLMHRAQGEWNVVSKALYEEIGQRKSVGLLVGSHVDGLAEVFYGIGNALANEGGVDIGTIYLRLAVLLKPNFDMAHHALAEVHESTKQYQTAIDAYNRIRPHSPLSMNAKIRRAYALNSLKRVDESVALLKKLVREQPNEVRPNSALGTVLRSHKRYAEAVTYYSKAIDLTKSPTRRDWLLFYSRGVCYERLKQWPKAEADLKRALKLDPEQPLILNYLGYSWVDQNIKLNEAMTLIRKAVKLKPDDGYFVDSLGWAYYRLGKFEKAVEQLERAVELRPDDPVINDHLGDAYWRVGRKLEAKFQWSQALSLKPEPEEVEKIKIKLAKGLAGLEEAQETANK